MSSKDGSRILVVERYQAFLETVSEALENKLRDYGEVAVVGYTSIDSAIESVGVQKISIAFVGGRFDVGDPASLVEALHQTNTPFYRCSSDPNNVPTHLRGLGILKKDGISNIIKEMVDVCIPFVT